MGSAQFDDAAAATTEVQPTNCDSCIHLRARYRARGSRPGRVNGFWSVLVVVKGYARLWKHSHFQVASTRPIARHIINDRDHAACVLRVSYCGPTHKQQPKTALIACGRSDPGW